MNKKGFTFFSDAVNIILIIFILIVFFAIMDFIDVSNFSNSEEKIGDMSTGLSTFENTYVVLNFLRTEVDSRDATVADLVYLWYNNNFSYENLVQESNIILSEVYGTCYTLLINDIVFHGVNPYDSVLPDLSSFTCIGFSISVDKEINLCLDISDFENRLQRGEEELCLG